MLTSCVSVVVSKGSSNIQGKWFVTYGLSKMELTCAQAMVDTCGGHVRISL